MHIYAALVLNDLYSFFFLRKRVGYELEGRCCGVELQVALEGEIEG